MTQRVIAAVDCGTNTIKLMIATLSAAGADVHVRTSRMVRLGQGVDKTGRLADEAMARTFAAINEYADLIRESAAQGRPVERIRFCATSATRDASNGDVFAAGVRARLGIDPEVVAGHEEARLSFDGAVRNLQETPVAPVLVLDIGGGSTEMILGDAAPTSEHSMNIGSVRMHERHLHSDPPTEAEIAAAVADIDAHLDASPVDPSLAHTVVGVAGTIITVAAGVLGLTSYDRDAIDQAVLARDDVHDFAAKLLAMSVGERLALPFMHPGRADVIGAGALILDRILRRTSAESIVVSEADILDGIAWSMA